MMLLSLDSSISRCGFAVLDGKGTVIRSGVIRTKEKDDMTERVYQISEDIKIILGSKDYTITHAVIETRGAFTYERSSNRFGKGMNQAALNKNSEAIGAIRLTLRQWGIPVLAVEAHVWKQKRPKKLDQMIASQHVGRKVSDDEADAILLGAWTIETQRIEGMVR